MSSSLSMRQLRAFLAVAQHGSFTAAATQLHLTQSALSVLIRELEKDLGVKLFDRNTRSTYLTEAGRQFLPAVDRMLDDLGAAISSIHDLRDKRRGVLRVAAPQLMACTLLPALLGKWQTLFPDIKVRVTDTLPENLLESLHSGIVDLAIGPDQPVAKREMEHKESILRTGLFRDEHRLVCPPSHPFATRTHVSWNELVKYPFIAPTRDFAERALPHVLGERAREMLQAPAYEVSYISTAIGMVAAGMGLTACPTYSDQLVKAHGLVMIPIVKPLLYREVCLYALSDRALPPAAQEFADYVLSQYNMKNRR